jgi:hypothetical protein
MFRHRTHHRNSTRPGSWKPIALIFLIGAAGIAWQMAYVRAKLPAVVAEVAAAEAEVASIFAQLSPPSDAKPLGELEKRTFNGGRRGKWQGVKSGFVWTRKYEVPGDFGPIADGYRKRLQGAGWVSFDSTPASEIQRVFKRGKWIATIGGGEWWDYPRRTGLSIRHEWDFRHRTDP